MNVQKWLTGNRGAAMFVALLLALLAGVPASAQHPTATASPSLEQAQRHQAVFVKRAAAIAKPRVLAPAPLSAALPSTPVGARQLLLHPPSRLLLRAATSAVGASTRPYRARAPPAV